MRLYLVTFALCSSWIAQQRGVASAQRFLREGFSNTMESDFRGEMALDDMGSPSGMTREMFLMQNVEWELEPPAINDDVVDSRLKRHIRKFLSAPIQLQLLKKQGKYGMRAIGTMEDGKKLRAFWRQGASGRRKMKAQEFLEASYDDAVRSRLFMVEFELQLPPMKRKGDQSDLVSVVYQVALEPGTMNPKAMIPRGSGRILLYPEGRESQFCMAGTCNVGLNMRAGIVDPSWAKGRRFFWKGRSPGVI